MDRIVVGTDGSSGGNAALARALNEATPYDATLSVIGAVAYKHVAGIPGAPRAETPTVVIPTPRTGGCT